VPGEPLEKQSQLNLVTLRNIIQPEEGEAVVGTSRDDQGVPWASLWGVAEGDKAPHVFFGHDAKRMLQQYPHATGLDTGCCYGKFLSAFILPQRELCQVPAREMYSEPGK
jgi:hypothetical protein